MSSNSKTLPANYGSYTLSVEWSESEPTVANNKSKITASASLSSGNTAFASNYTQHLSIYWYDNNNYKNGVKIAGLDFSECGISPYGTKSTSGSVWVEHKDDGTLNGYCVTYFTNNNAGPYAPDSNSCSTANTALSTIARASTPTASPNPLTISAAKNALKVDTNRKSTSFTHTITATFGSQSFTKTGVQGSTTIDIPYSILAQFAAGSTTLKGTVSCTTYNGSTNIGTKTTDVTLKLDQSKEHAEIGTVTLEDTNPKSAALEDAGTFIRTASNLKATIPISVVGSYTNLNECMIKCGNFSQYYILSGTSKTITFEYDGIDADSMTITVVDERGNSVTKTVTWTLIPYVALTVTGSVDRVTETGEDITFTLTGKCFGGTFGSSDTKNVISVSYKYKQHNASAWIDGGQTFTFEPSESGETTFNFSEQLSGFAYNSQYDFVFTLADIFTTATTRELLLTQGIPVYAFGPDWFAVYGSLFLHPDRDDVYRFIDIYEALQAIFENTGIDNLAKPTGASGTNNGITYTVNTSDGTITAKGTATAFSSFDVATFTAVSGVTYLMEGCPEGGDSRSYYLGISGSMIDDTGDGIEFTRTGATTVYIGIFAGLTVDLTFKPVVRDKRIAA